MPGRAVRGRVASSPDTETLYPKHIDSGAARVVTLCFGFCSLVRLPLQRWGSLAPPCVPVGLGPDTPFSCLCDAQLCLVLFYSVLALAIIPQMKEGDWQDVRCRAKDASISSEPSRVRAAAPSLLLARSYVSCH
jgi:hypothetical protein